VTVATRCFAMRRSITRHCRPWKSPRAKGFTSLGLLAVIVPALSLFLLGMPLLDKLTDSGNVQLLEQNSLAAHLEYAREEAIRRQLPVTICPSHDNRNCLPGGNWQEGWIIFTDLENPSLNVSVGDKLLHRQDGEAGNQPLVASMDVLQYLPDGSLNLD
jgi:type IV fimbrial biogenesis protein FimT